MSKIIAFYLPQYHSIPENDEWWGKDFTEWTNVKKAKPLFNNHNQPREPLNDNYYNLLDLKIRKWQADLAKEYGVYGFCYYHYWFNGKKLLEKPIEEILRLKEPDLPFCMCWANEPWTRAWDGGEKNILMPQEYGDEEDWNNHFEYLLKFFKDPRYILIQNKPVFIIYRTQSIDKIDSMISQWNKMAVKNGFDGIYVVEMVTIFQKNVFSKQSDAVVEFEPMYTLGHDLSKRYRLNRKIKKYIYKYKYGKKLSLNLNSYDYIWKRINKRKSSFENRKIFPGAFTDWDNSARKSNRAIIFIGANPSKFENYLKIQVNKAKDLYKSEFVFINAWNEWGEGTYLEPDKKNEYGYLEAIKEVMKDDVEE